MLHHSDNPTSSTRRDHLYQPPDTIVRLHFWNFAMEITATIYIYTYISQAKCHFLMIVTLTALIITTLIWYACPSPYNLSILWWPSIGLLLLYAVSVNHKLLTLTPLVKFGDVSFSFYLIHVLNIQYFDIILTKLNIVLVPLVRIFTILVLTVALSFFIHYLFVIPVERFIRSKISRVGS